MTKVTKNPISEARRHISNAKRIIKENLTVDNMGYYDDPKYVKMAGHTAYTGVLEALKPFMKTKKTRLTITDYQDAIAQKNKSMIKLLQSVYNYLHLLAGYDGDLNTSSLKLGIAQANKMIDWAEKNLPASALAGTHTKKNTKKV